MVIRALRHFRNVWRSLFASKGGRWYVFAVIVVGAPAILLIERYLSGTVADVVYLMSGAATIAIGGILWLRRPPRTFESNLGPAYALLLESAATVLSTLLWLVEDLSSVLAFLSLISEYLFVPFVIIFFATARPRIGS